MKYDFEKILLCVKNDEQWIRKITIGSLFIIIIAFLLTLPVFAIFLFKSFVINFLLFAFFYIAAGVIALAVVGFGLQFAHDYRLDSNSNLPDWHNFGSLTFVGFKSVLGSILFLLPVILLGIISLVFEIYYKGNTSHSEIFKTVYFVFNAVANIIYVLYFVFYFLFCANFIKEFNLFEFLNFSSAYHLIRGNTLNYLILVVIILALNTLFNTVALLVALTIVGLLLIPFFSVYIQIVSSCLIARFVQITDESKNV